MVFVVVLDEATAFADPENEANIHAAIARLTRGKTPDCGGPPVVDHSGLRPDRSHEQGMVAEVGKHGDLVEKKDGIYANLWAKFIEAQGWGPRKRNN